MTFVVLQVLIFAILLFLMYIRLASQKPSDNEQLSLERSDYEMALMYQLLICDGELRRDMYRRHAVRRGFYTEFSARTKSDVVRMMRSGELGAGGWLTAILFFATFYVMKLKCALYTGYGDVFAMLGLGMTVFRGLKE